MKTRQKYIQVFIESENDLPKEAGAYICQLKDYPNPSIEKKRFLTEGKNNYYDSEDWLKNVEWYLQLLSNEPEITDEDIEKWASYFIANEDMLYEKEIAIAGAKAIRDGLIKKNK
jgi:hypothetical protein